MALPPLRIEIGADPSEAIAGFERVQASAAHTGKAIDNMGSRLAAANNNMRNAGDGSRRFGAAIQNTSYQVQDFAVQLQSGTSATTALSQQLPQLLGGFGMLGVVLGGAVAVIALLVNEMDRTDSAIRRVMINLNLLSSRSISETEQRIADLRDTFESNNISIAATEELLRRMGNSARNNGEEEKKYIDQLKLHNEEIKRRIALEEQRLQKLKEAEKTPVKPGKVERTRGVRGGKDDMLGGESSGANVPGSDAYTIQLQNRLAQLQQFTMTEQELLASRYADRQATLVEALANELITEKQYLEQSKALHEKQAQDLANIEAAKRNTMLNTTSSLFGALANLAKQGGKKTAGIAKAFGVAEAIINTYVGATNALRTVPYPYNFVAAAAVIANGMASVASIMSVNTNGGTNAPALSTGGAAPAATPGPLEVRLSGFGANDMFSGSQLSGLFDRLQQEAGDRGLKFIGASA